MHSLLILLLLLQPLLKASELLLSNETEDPYAYDTSILWRKKTAKNVRFNLDEELSLLESSPKPSLTELSPTSVDEIFKTEEVEPIQFLEINKEWIETELIPLFKSGQMLPKELIQKIIMDAKNFFRLDYTIEDISVPQNGKVIVVGDIHGQFESTLTIFEDFGYPSENLIYVFNGDIVDRGNKSLECLLMVYAYKIALPFSFYVTRGNHESRSVAKTTFFNECQDRLTDYPEAFEDFQDSFDMLPYGHVIRKHFFVTHGGLCPGMEVKSLRSLPRSHFTYKNDYTLYSMLWNDPADPREKFNEFYLAPSPRGDVCRRFHPYVTFDFLKRNKLEMLVRSHELVDQGALLCHDDRCLTIFSAPNYRQRGNRGAVLVITEDSYTIERMREANIFNK